jgi:hypothetical protein
MKTLKLTIKFILFSLICTCIFVGCTDQLPNIGVSEKLTYTQGETTNYIINQAFKHHATITIYCPDKQYIAIRHHDLETYTKWFVKYTAGSHYEAEKRDCEDFANLYKSIMPFLCLDPAPAGLAIAVIAVKLPTGAHALNAVLTEKGIYIVEPQNGTITHLDDYEFASKIYRIDL